MGIQPLVVVAPTIAGVQAGRDEILDAAVAHLRAAIVVGVPATP